MNIKTWQERESADKFEKLTQSYMQDEIDELAVQNTVLQNDLNTALYMLAGWCVSVHENGSSWDAWDEHYKDAMYRDGPLRVMLDQAITKTLGDV